MCFCSGVSCRGSGNATLGGWSREGHSEKAGPRLRTPERVLLPSARLPELLRAFPGTETRVTNQSPTQQCPRTYSGRRALAALFGTAGDTHPPTPGRPGSQPRSLLTLAWVEQQKMEIREDDQVLRKWKPRQEIEL